jgi:hypothetical protein
MTWCTALMRLESTVWDEIELKMQPVRLAAFALHQSLKNTVAHNS